MTGKGKRTLMIFHLIIIIIIIIIIMLKVEISNFIHDPCINQGPFFRIIFESQ